MFSNPMDSQTWAVVWQLLQVFLVIFAAFGAARAVVEIREKWKSPKSELVVTFSAHEVIQQPQAATQLEEFRQLLSPFWITEYGAFRELRGERGASADTVRALDEAEERLQLYVQAKREQFPIKLLPEGYANVLVENSGTSTLEDVKVFVDRFVAGILVRDGAEDIVIEPATRGRYLVRLDSMSPTEKVKIHVWVDSKYNVKIEGTHKNGVAKVRQMVLVTGFPAWCAGPGMIWLRSAKSVGKSLLVWVVIGIVVFSIVIWSMKKPTTSTILQQP